MQERNQMAAFALGFRDGLEAAIIIGLALAVLVRLGRGGLAQALWVGVGAGAVVGFSIGTGLAAADLAATGAGWTTVEVTMMALAMVALAGVSLTARRLSAESGPAVWLMVALGAFATLPQVLDLLTRVSANPGVASLMAGVAGMVAAAGVAALMFAALTRVKAGQGAAPRTEPAAGELAPVRQRVE
jgi:high-affinity iron transporter